MMTLQLRLGGTLLAASRRGQQTYDFIEWRRVRANGGSDHKGKVIITEGTEGTEDHQRSCAFSVETASKIH
jgi:hypothetical protein